MCYVEVYKILRKHANGSTVVQVCNLDKFVQLNLEEKLYEKCFMLSYQIGCVNRFVNNSYISYQSIS